MDLNKLLIYATSKGASDLHILPDMPPLLRINGLLTPIKGQDVLSAEMTKDMLYAILNKYEQQNFETNLVYELALAAPKIGNFRVSIFHQLNGIAAVFRIVPEKVPSFEELDLPAVLKNLLVLEKGLILVAGPTGSGKSTTMAAMLDYLNTYHSLNIITIEDPIEFIHQSKKSVFHQLQVGRDTLNFSSALRASLRQDPNVILLGELRDLETMRLALIAAETGHLVLATIHANSAPIAISRFADVFPTEEKNRVRTLLSETLQAVIFQTLIKKTSGGRIAAFEIMLATNPIRHYIREDMPAHMESTMQMSSGKGMSTLELYLQHLVSKRLISPVVAQSTLLNRGSFKDSLQGPSENKLWKK